MDARIHTTLGASAIFLMSCTGVDSPPLLDENGEPLAAPGFFDRWLEVESVRPDDAEIALRPVIRVRFNDPIDINRVLDFDVLTLNSNGIRVSGRVRWDLAENELEWRALSNLEEGLRYRVVFNENRLRSVTGVELLRSPSPEFMAVADGPSEESREVESVRWAEVDALIEVRCGSCHRDPEWQLNPLEYETLVGARATEVDTYLVRPFDPANSYLMHKILPEYPVRRFGVQPPIWSDEEPLSSVEIRLISDWIESGAK